MRKHHISFKSAFSGLFWALSSQPNFRVHIFLAAAAVSLGLFLQTTRLEMIIVIFTIVLGLVAEMINTSLEAITDLVSKEWRQEAKIAKDVAAGMMLTVAFGAAVVAVVIFWPYFF